MYNLRELLVHIMHTYIMMYTGWPRLLCNTLARATDWGFRNLTTIDLSEFILLARVLLVASIVWHPPEAPEGAESESEVVFAVIKRL